MTLSISTISMGIVALAGLIGGILLLQSYHQNRNDILRYLIVFFFGMGVMGTFFTAGTLAASVGSVWATYFFVAGHYTLFSTLAIVIQLPMNLIAPKATKSVFYAMAAFAVVCAVVVTLNPPLNISFHNNLVFWNVPVFTSNFIALIDVIFSLVFIITFIYFGFKTKEGAYKARSFLFALGILIFLIGGPYHNVARTAAQFFIADVSTAVGLAIVFFGVYVPRWFGNKNAPASPDEAQNTPAPQV